MEITAEQTQSATQDAASETARVQIEEGVASINEIVSEMGAEVKLDWDTKGNPILTSTSAKLKPIVDTWNTNYSFFSAVRLANKLVKADEGAKAETARIARQTRQERTDVASPRPAPVATLNEKTLEAEVAAGRVEMTPEIATRLNKYWEK